MSKTYFVRINISSRKMGGQMPPVFVAVIPGGGFSEDDGVIVAHAVYRASSARDAYRALEAALEEYGMDVDDMKHVINLSLGCLPFMVSVYTVDAFIRALIAAGFDVSLETMTLSQYRVASTARGIVEQCYQSE